MNNKIKRLGEILEGAIESGGFRTLAGELFGDMENSLYSVKNIVQETFVIG